MQIASQTPLRVFNIKKEMFVSLHKLIKYSAVLLLKHEFNSWCFLCKHFEACCPYNYVFIVN